mgnify:CR=1 FL=1
MKVLEKLKRSDAPLTSVVERDEFIEASETAFDCRFDGTSTFHPWKLPTKLPKDFKIGVIVGSSGSGKSTLVDIILGLQKPFDGMSLVDDVNIDIFNSM